MKKPYFPMFVDLSGRQVTVVGGGSVALRRSETLLYFGVDIKVIAPEIRSEFYRLDSEGKVVLCKKHIFRSTRQTTESCVTFIFRLSYWQKILSSD